MFTTFGHFFLKSEFSGVFHKKLKTQILNKCFENNGNQIAKNQKLEIFFRAGLDGIRCIYFSNLNPN